MGQGEQWLIDIYDFPNIRAGRCEEILVDAVKIMKATVMGSSSFEGNLERTSFVILDESHLSIHDYKNGEAALDMFTCGGKKMDEELLSILACPVCKADVRLEKQEIVCTKCGRKYPVRDGIPIMLIDEAKQ